MYVYRNYVSPHITKVEMGLEQLMEQYDGEFKVKQLLLHQQSQFELAASANNSSRTPRGGGGNYFRRMSAGSVGAVAGMTNLLGGMIGSVGKRRSSNPALLPAMGGNNTSRRPSNVSTSSLTNPISTRRLSSSSIASTTPLTAARRNSSSSVSSAQGLILGANPNANGNGRNANRRNSNVSVLSDASSTMNGNGNEYDANGVSTSTKRKGSNFAVHVQLMNNLMNQDDEEDDL